MKLRVPSVDVGRWLSVALAALPILLLAVGAHAQDAAGGQVKRILFIDLLIRRQITDGTEQPFSPGKLILD